MKERLECRCGGTLRKEGNQYICDYCDSIYLISADEKGELFAYQPIEKKHIQTGQIAQKATTLQVKEVIVRQIKLDDDIAGQVAQESMDLDKSSRIGLIKGYLSTADWEKVDEHVNGLLLENKDCLIEELDYFINSLIEYKTAMQNDDAVTLKKLLADGKKCKEDIDGI